MQQWQSCAGSEVHSQRVMGFADLTEIDVSNWRTDDEEVRGKRSKLWLRRPDDGTSWLRKSVRPKRPYENLIEAFVLELARQSNIDTSEGNPCRWIDPDGAHWGLISRYFCDEHEFTMHGAELLSDALPSDVPQKYGYSLELLLTSLPTLQRTLKLDPLELHKVLAFDAWVGNGDRHFENWAVICHLKSRQLRWAPMYDPAACLGSELLEPQVIQLVDDRNRLLKYVANCPSGFGDGRSRTQKMSEVINRLVETPEWQDNIKTWLGEFSVAFASLKKSLAEEVPWLPESRQSLALKLLEVRLESLVALTRCE